MRKVILTIFSESEVLWTFLVSAKPVIGYESKTNNKEVKLKFTPKGGSNNYKSLHFVQSCISKAVL